MASFNAYPPVVVHATSSRPVDISAAHDILHSFLQLADLDPAYRPDSTLSERGPEANSSSGNPNLTLHHLNRIKLGLEGINLGVEDIDAGFFGERNARSTRQGEGERGKWQDQDSRNTPFTAGPPKVMSTADEDGDIVLTAQDANERDGVDGEGWQDPQDFELAQDDQDVDGNNAERDPAAPGMKGMGEEDMIEAKTGRLIHLNEDLGREEGRVETVGPEVLNHAQSTEEERRGPAAETKRPLTREEKEERKKLKRIRSKEEKPTARMAKAKERSNESPWSGTAGEHRRDELEGTSPQKKKKKKMSETRKQP